MHLRPVGNGGDTKPVLEQEFFQELLDFLIVINNQNMGFTSRTQSPPPFGRQARNRTVARSLVHNVTGLNHFTKNRT
ncbi:hypothetical protein SMB34_06440 [Thalassospira permensis NBRC 106175]|uniref:Uncharacterized protein n=1 Tax=Thalassospira permensis NBRC 106175 TaxID=1353532 RepID=A0ABR4TLK9_9PROT|nr:hypothetical protein SMB34_06440 [Thalassospira permensis NBRC 106175]